jgi:hypothetical protein
VPKNPREFTFKEEMERIFRRGATKNALGGALDAPIFQVFPS